jgi:effector-binding domain-containing protein
MAARLTPGVHTIRKMIETPKIVEYPGQTHAAVIHIKDIPRNTIQTEMGPAIQENLRVLAEQDVKPIGPMFAHHLTQSSKVFNFEVGFPVQQAIKESGRVKNSSLPSGTMAFTRHVGPYEELHAAWTEFSEWMSLNICSNGMHHLKKGDTLFEIYTIGPETTANAHEYQTELYQTLQQKE